MRSRLQFILAVCLTQGAATCDAAESTLPAERPNVVFLVADDLGYADLGAQGSTDVSTPHIDSLAEHGLRFTGGYVSAPVCSPSRAGLITGRYQTRFGHEFNHPLADRSPVGLPVTEKTAADWFREAGYVTGHVGKWHLGNPKTPTFSPHARGFDASVWFPGQRKLPPLTFFRNGEAGKTNDSYVDAAIAREAAEFIDRNRTKPWFLYVAFLTPHQPLDMPPGAEESFANITSTERRKCVAMLSLLDAGVGRILKALRDTGQFDNTLIVFTSDNGAPPKNGSRNTPLRGNKGTTWEGGIRTPLVIQWTGGLPAGRVTDQPVISLDLLRTALAAARVNVPDAAKLDGVDLLPLLAGKTDHSPPRALYWRYGDQMAVRQGDWKLVRALDTLKQPPSLASGLFNLAKDPGEQDNQMAEVPEKAAELQKRWDTWNSANVPALWTSDGAEDEPRPGQKPAR